jgi:hypothetical protein
MSSAARRDISLVALSLSFEGLSTPLVFSSARLATFRANFWRVLAADSLAFAFASLRLLTRTTNLDGKKN